ncbi:hypothetical protein D918_03439 [Trichuris suis]|nr:hypothetical protein D918_03439 [Trichuris suis]
MNDYDYNSQVLDDSKKQELLYRGVAKAIQYDVLNALMDSKSPPANKCQYYQRSHVQCFRQNYDNAVRVNIVMETRLTEQQLAAALKELEGKSQDSTYYRFTQSRITPVCSNMSRTDVPGM